MRRGCAPKRAWNAPPSEFEIRYSERPIRLLVSCWMCAPSATVEKRVAKKRKRAEESVLPGCDANAGQKSGPGDGISSLQHTLGGMAECSHPVETTHCIALAQLAGHVRFERRRRVVTGTLHGCDSHVSILHDSVESESPRASRGGLPSGRCRGGCPPTGVQRERARGGCSFEVMQLWVVTASGCNWRSA